MPLFQILQKPEKSNIIKDDDSELIAEKFSWLAALFAPLWFISKNLWLELVLWLAFIIALGAVSALIGSEAVSWLYIVSAIFIGFEAPNIMVSALKRRGYILRGDLIAPNYEQAQIAWIRYRLG